MKRTTKAHNYHHIPYDDRRIIIALARSIRTFKSRIKYFQNVRNKKLGHTVKINDTRHKIFLFLSYKQDIINMYPVIRYNSRSLCSVKKTLLGAIH